MRSAPPVLAPLRRRRFPLAGAFFTPADLTGAALVAALSAVSGDLVAAHSNPSAGAFFQRRNSRFLVRRIQILRCLFDYLRDSPAAADVCLKEFYILLHRSKILLDYCSQSGRIWLLLQNLQVSGHFHDLNQEISTLLDVFPLGELRLAADLREQIELLKRQTRRSKLYADPEDELLRLKIFSFLHEFEKGRVPDPADLRAAFVDRLAIRDGETCRSEIEFLEEQINSQEEDVHPSVIGGVVAITRYCQFMFFGIDGEGDHEKKSKKGFRNSSSSSITTPKDFSCPISLDLMKDPVITSTGQTYDRASITQWMDEGHNTCPNSGQILTHNHLIPNLALRSLISHWCAAQGLPYDPPDGWAEFMATAFASKAAVEANRATAEILVGVLSAGSEDAKTAAAREVRLLAKTGKENRASIAEAGAIPVLRNLLSSSNPSAQENSVTAILNLSIHDTNKSRIVEEGCLRWIVDVLIGGWTTEARENSAATLFSLSSVHEYKKMIADEPGALEALARLLRSGSSRGERDAVTALFNISTHAECCERMVESGAVSALVGALETEIVAEDAAGALALLVRHPVVGKDVARGDYSVVMGLVRLMRRGSPRGKENAVAALHEMCRSGGIGLTQRVARTPAFGGLVQSLLFTGTKRARRKAASLARMCQRCTAETPNMGGLDAFPRNTSFRRSNFVVTGGDVSVSVVPTMAISVPVL